MTVRRTASTITDTELDQLYNQLDTLRAVSRGYCPTCGRGDAAPTVTDWEQQKQRADQAEELLSIAHDTSNRSEAERTRAEAAIDRLRAIAAQWQASVRPGESHPAAHAILTALNKPAPTAAIRATHRQEQP